MVVLQINSVYDNTSSTGKIIESIHKIMMMKAGNNGYIAYGRHNNKLDTSKAIRIGNELDLYLNAIITRLFDLHGFGPKWSTIRLIEKIFQSKKSLLKKLANILPKSNFIKKSLWTSTLKLFLNKILNTNKKRGYLMKAASFFT